MKKLLLHIAGLLLLTSAALAEDKQWLCLADLTTGFNFEGGKWKQRNFKPVGKYLIKCKLSECSFYNYSFKYEFPCDNVLEGPDYIKCESYLSNDEIRLEMPTLKFTVSTTDNYFGSGPTFDSVSLTIGKCAPL